MDSITSGICAGDIVTIATRGRGSVVVETVGTVVDIEESRGANQGRILVCEANDDGRPMRVRESSVVEVVEVD